MSDPKHPESPFKPTPQPEHATKPLDYPLTNKPHAEPQPAKHTQPTEHGSPMTTDPTSRPVVQPPVNTRPVSKDPAHPTLAELKEQAEWDDKHQRAENR